MSLLVTRHLKFLLLIYCYTVISGDLLQHFLTVIFNKLDKGETWDDDFELNTLLQVMLLNPIK